MSVKEWFPSFEEEKAPLCLGIDEAGRGPVLGPMVYAAAFCPISAKDSLAKVGFADSKALTEKQRDNLYEKITKGIAAVPLGFMTQSLSPEELSEKMLLINKVNLNKISHDAAIHLIRRALEEKKYNIQQIFVDTVGPPGKYESKLKELFPQVKEITVSKKADSLFPIVSAASIAAKVVRDFELKNWEYKETIVASKQFGSGYPGDPNTKAWLKSNLDPVFGFPSVIRFSWKTTETLLQKSAAKIVWSDADMEDEDFKLKGNKRFKYFTQNNMAPVTTFD